MHWNYYVIVILNFSILIAGVIAIFRFAQIRDIYRPFIYLIWIGCITEILSTYFAYAYQNNLAIGSVYRLLESLFLIWFFIRLGAFKKYRRAPYFLILIFLFIWFADNFFSSHFHENVTFYFDIIYALSIVMLSIKVVNELLFTEKELLKNATFLICMGLIIFFTYQVIQRMFWLWGLRESADFMRRVQRILTFVNCFTNLVYAVAVLFMRKRQPFTFGFNQ